MKFYHSSSFESWIKIQKEGCLWGIRNAPSRCTYLALELKDCPKDDVYLEVCYDPLVNPGENNYFEECWQTRVGEYLIKKEDDNE